MPEVKYNREKVKKCEKVKKNAKKVKEILGRVSNLAVIFFNGIPNGMIVKFLVEIPWDFYGRFHSNVVLVFTPLRENIFL